MRCVQDLSRYHVRIVSFNKRITYFFPHLIIHSVWLKQQLNLPPVQELVAENFAIGTPNPNLYCFALIKISKYSKIVYILAYTTTHIMKNKNILKN